jgi:threonine aldolase
MEYEGEVNAAVEKSARRLSGVDQAVSTGCGRDADLVALREACKRHRAALARSKTGMP